MLSGSHQVLVDSGGGLEWRDAHVGDYVRIPCAAPHAHRNVSDEPAVDLFITTVRMGEFFREVGRSVGRRMEQGLRPASSSELVRSAGWNNGHP